MAEMNKIPEDELHLYEWPESERLQKALSAEPPKLEHCYTMPGVKASGEFEDLVAETSMHRFGTTVSRPSCSSTIDGLRKLIAAGNLRAAANLTAKMLTDLHQGIGMAGQISRNTLQSFQIWAYRLQLLMALKAYPLLNDELIPFEELDAPDLYFQYYPSVFGDRKGTLVPFALRLVHAEALRFTPYPWEAIKRIDALERNVRQVIETITKNGGLKEHIDDWNERLSAVLKSRARTLFFLKEYGMSMTAYERLVVSLPIAEQRKETWLMMMRMAAAVGDEGRIERFLNNGSKGVYVNDRDVLMNQSLKSVFFGDYTQALDILRSISGDICENPNVCSNAAVCMLYEGHVEEAFTMLRSYRGSPNEPLCMNFITIAELATVDVSNQKLALFKKNVDRFPDSFDPAVLKLPPTV